MKNEIIKPVVDFINNLVRNSPEAIEQEEVQLEISNLFERAGGFLDHAKPFIETK